MKTMLFKRWNTACPAFCLVVLLMLLVYGHALGGEKYRPKFERWNEEKKFFDDPRPVLRNYPLHEIIPPEDYAGMTFDMEEMSKKWQEAVGFKSPDITGAIAPDLIPGRYGFQDKEKYPGLKELMLPLHYRRFNPGSAPFACNFQEIEVVPTRQVYHSLPVSEATLQNMGKTGQDSRGYLIEETYRNGFPFPRPSGPFKAQQVVYNFRERYMGLDHGVYVLQRGKSWDRSLREIYDFAMEWWGIRLSGRVVPPLGWYDERARKRGELRLVNIKYISPRDQFGNVFWLLSRRGTEDPNQVMIWLAQIRRLRKLSGTDTQDTFPGVSLTFDDSDGFSQKLSPTIYPYEYRIVAEREFLVPHYTMDGAEYLSRNGLELKNVRMERRPLYVVEMIQKDPRYVYGKRVLYIDRETFFLIMIENYDQKGRLWRTYEENYSFYPELGLANMYSAIVHDYQDPQSTYLEVFNVPPAWLSREDTSIGCLAREGK